MADLHTRLAELAHASADPRAQLDRYLAQGKKVVGCFPVYTPEELVHASGMIPMGLWGAQTELKHAKRYLPAFACPISAMVRSTSKPPTAPEAICTLAPLAAAAFSTCS